MEVSASIAARAAALSPEQRAAILSALSPPELEALEYSWAFWARPDQLPPEGAWRTWLLMGGRGSGKTRSAAEWVRSEVESGRRRYLGIIGPTADTLRSIQVEGPSGILATAPPDNRPSYEPSTRRIVWPNGAVARLFSAEEPERLRGPNLDALWADEIAAWDDPEKAWDMANFALRLPGPLGDPPRALVSTTPKPLPLLKTLLASEDTVVTRARTFDNAANLDASTLVFYRRKYEGTTLGRQELYGELLTDTQGALWTRQMIADNRVAAAPAEFVRVVVAIDPSGSSAGTSDETGIVVAGLGRDAISYILEDASGRYSPMGWAMRAVMAFEQYEADRIIAESNFGGAMVEATIRAVASRVPVRLVHASRGKAVRAEPVVGLYEQGKVRHVGMFSELEDQLCEWVPGSARSPDRLDALVWAVNELMVERQVAPAKFVYIPRARI